MATFSGGCHCGAVRYTCDAEPLWAGHCQCSDCRRLSGTGHLSSMAVPAASVQLTGAPSGYRHRADSGNELTRSFCGRCGAPIYSTNSGVPGLAFLRASSLDDPGLFKPQAVAWTRSAPAWDHMDPALPRYPGNRPRPKP
jgi:hypothetical protein